MPNTEKLRTWSVKLTTLSPLFIGSGKTLSPYSDFIQEKNTLIYLDKKEIERVISGNPELIDAYVTEIRKNMENTTANVSLKNFITTRLKLSLESVTKQKIPLVGTIGRQQLRQFISTAGRPFIPGSSIKGAFKTAVLFDWLVSDKEGKSVLEELRKLVKEKKSDEFNRFDIVQRCFGNISEDGFRFLHISDSETIPAEKIQATELKRVSILEKKGHSIPQPAECLAEKTETKLSITLQEPTGGVKLNFQYKEGLKDLFKKTKKISRKTVDAELAELDSSEDDRNPDLESFLHFYESLEKEIEKLQPNETILRIGSGKTYFDNSIGHAVDDDNELNAFLKLIDKKFSSFPYPKTRTAVIKNDKPFRPLGWVKLTII